MYIAPVHAIHISISLSELLPAQYVSPALAWHFVVRHFGTWFYILVAFITVLSIPPLPSCIAVLSTIQ